MRQKKFRGIDRWLSQAPNQSRLPVSLMRITHIVKLPVDQSLVLLFLSIPHRSSGIQKCSGLLRRALMVQSWWPQGLPQISRWNSAITSVCWVLISTALLGRQSCCGSQYDHTKFPTEEETDGVCVSSDSRDDCLPGYKVHPYSIFFELQ
jgi:hypothetical protein